MKRCMKVAAMCMAVICLAVALAGCSNEPHSTALTNNTSLSSTDTVTPGQLTVGVNTGNAPLAGTTSAGIVGIDVDIAGALGDEMGLPVQIVDVGSNAVNALANKKVDVVLGIEASDKSTDIAKSATYLETGTALFAKSATASIPTAESNPKIGVQSASVSSWAVTDQYGASSIKTESDLTSAFNDLANGTVQYVAADAVVGSYAASANGKEAHIIAVLGQLTGYCAGTLSTNTNMKNAIAKAMTTITKNGVTGVVKAKWLGSSLDLTGVKIVTTATSSDTATADEAAADALATDSTDDAGTSAN